MNTFEREKNNSFATERNYEFTGGGKNDEKVVYINCRYDRISGTLCLRSRAKALGTTYQRSDWLMVSRQNISGKVAFSFLYVLEAVVHFINGMLYYNVINLTNWTKTRKYNAMVEDVIVNNPGKNLN